MTVSCWSVLNYASHDIYIYILFTSYAYSSMNTTRIVLQYRVQLVLCIREQQEKHLQYAYVSIKLDAKISKYTEYYQLVRASTTLVRSRILVCIACTIVRARIIYIYNTIVRYYAQYVCILFILANSTLEQYELVCILLVYDRSMHTRSIMHNTRV